MKVAFIGQSEIVRYRALKRRLTDVVEKLIVTEGADTFYFGSRTEFNDLCCEIVTELKEKFPHIRRIYVRPAYECVNQDYLDYMAGFEETVFASPARGTGVWSSKGRNEEMIELCDAVMFYYSEANKPKRGKKSITRMAFDYAVKRKKKIYVSGYLVDTLNE